MVAEVFRPLITKLISLGSRCLAWEKRALMKFMAAGRNEVPWMGVSVVMSAEQVLAQDTILKGPNKDSHIIRPMLWKAPISEFFPIDCSEVAFTICFVAHFINWWDRFVACKESSNP
jgi:hypothetical protein